ncbi:HNH endonuclease signature motif containing protein [Photobacterium atrarenae]|uniref:HNH endonuclease n=1 Tax=Photobacterium atrarenae TaxID=865757 RepID=A0ABY5GPP0_9GAMM|nr:HNH endonuclease signature motif containing protein [Photobacterium atrarenae]UTV30888.1 HNH endonuclease [Photobacterium atrarenae]
MPKGICHKYTEDQRRFLAENRDLPRQELTDQFNQRFGTCLAATAIKSYCKRHGLKTGRSGQIAQGNVPWNKGKKGLYKGSCTSFKKGHTPANLKPIGHERICSKDGYVLVKVAEPDPYTNAPTRYRPKHIIEWENHHGPVPDGHVIRFKDGVNTHWWVSNLECVSKPVNLRANQNKVHELPPELKPTGMMLSKLEVATFDAMKNNKRRA